MAKLTRAQAKAHAEAVSILQQERLSEDDKEFVYRNWNEGANHVNGAAGAFFTPYDMAVDFAIDAGGGRIIDLCAGIGMLSYAIWQRSRFNESRPQITCVERNSDYLEVGKSSFRKLNGFTPMCLMFWIWGWVASTVQLATHRSEISSGAKMPHDTAVRTSNST